MSEGTEVRTGVVRWFNADKGYGFLADGEEEFFCHYSEIVGTGYRTLSQDAAVEFLVIDTPKGKAAAQVRVV